jgi:outer membrane protein TolC
MKKIIYLLILSAFCGTITAQTDTLKLSLNQALQLGLNNRFDAKGSSLNVDIAKNELAKSKKKLLPDISASGKITYDEQVQPTIVPAGYLGFTEPQKIALEMKDNTAFSLDLNYSVYKPGLYTDIKIASNNLDLEKEKNRKSDIDIKVEIAEAYDNVLLKSLQFEIAQKNENRYKEYYNLANGKYSNGALLESDMQLAELDYKNAEATTEKQKQNYLLSIQNLKFKINVSLQSVIIFTDSLQSSVETNVSKDIANNAIVNRSEIKQLKIQQLGYELQLKKAKQNYLPTLSLFANYTQFFQNDAFNYSNNFFWAPVSYIGAKLSIPITGSIKNTNQIKEFNLKLAQTGLEMKQKSTDVQYEVQEARTKLDNAKQNLTVTNENYLLSGKVYELKKQQYGLGSFSYEKLLDTEKSLSNTEQEYITAVYDVFIAKINYQKVTGMY